MTWIQENHRNKMKGKHGKQHLVGDRWMTVPEIVKESGRTQAAFDKYVVRGAMTAEQFINSGRGR